MNLTHPNHPGSETIPTTRLLVEQFDPLVPRPGGIDTCIRGLVKYAPSGLRLRIAGVDAVGDKTLGEWITIVADGVTYEFMPVARLDHANLRRVIPHSVKLLRGVSRYLKGQTFDAVQSHRINVGGGLLRLFPGTPHVQFLHSSGVQNLGEGSKSYFRWFRSWYRRLEASVIPRSAKAVVFSQSGADRLAEAFGKHVHFSPTWYDPEYFFPAPASDEGRGRSIVWACRIEPAKNPELAIDAFNKLPDNWHLTIAGGGGLESEMRARAQASKAADRIIFAGAVAKKDMGEFLRRFDYLLMTSRFEGFSRSVVEALASGLPVVTTPGGEPNGLVVDGVNGGRVASADAELFPAAFDIAESSPPDGPRSTVTDLSAATIVPRVLALEATR